MTAILTNNASGTLSGSLTNVATTFTLNTSQGALFPTTSSTNYFYATIQDTSGNLEIIKCTTRTGDVFTTIVRAQGGTTARAFSANDIVECRAVAANWTADEILPAQSSSTNYFLKTNGTNAAWSLVAKADVGLGSVENTALSTWTGATSITTLGTVATGTWSATAIGNTKGGTGQDSSAWTGLAECTAGVWGTATANVDYLAPALGNVAVTGAKTITFNSVVAQTGVSGTMTVAFANAQKQKVTLSGNVTTVTLSFPGAGHYQLHLISSTYTVTWPTIGSTFQWLGSASAPTLATGTSGVAIGGIVNLYYDGTMTIASYSKSGA